MGARTPCVVARMRNVVAGVPLWPDAVTAHEATRPPRHRVRTAAGGAAAARAQRRAGGAQPAPGGGGGRRQPRTRLPLLRLPARPSAPPPAGERRGGPL